MFAGIFMPKRYCTLSYIPLFVNQEALRAAFAVEGYGEAVGFAVGEKDSVVILLRHFPIAQNILRFVTSILDDTDHRDGNIERIEHSLGGVDLQIETVDRDQIREAPLGMLQSSGQYFRKIPDVIIGFRLELELTILARVRKTVLDHRHHANDVFP